MRRRDAGARMVSGGVGTATEGGMAAGGRLGAAAALAGAVAIAAPMAQATGGIGCRARDGAAAWAALVMVSGFERGDASVRLVQNFGRPEDAGRAAADGEPGAAEPPKRRRGGPPGSRSEPQAA